MVRIKLARVGKSKFGSFRVIVADSRRDTSGKCLEIVGAYSPRSNPKIVSLKKERILYWISKGAQVTDSLHNVLVMQGVIVGKRRKVNRTVKHTTATTKTATLETPRTHPEKPAAG